MEGMCRICREDDQVENLESLCTCSGSIQYVHRECLQQWCDYKSEAVCEICHVHFPIGYVAGANLEVDPEQERTFMHMVIRVLSLFASALLVLPAILPLIFLAPFWLLLLLIRGGREDLVDADADMQEYEDVDPVVGEDLDHLDFDEDDLEPYFEDSDTENEFEIAVEGGDVEEGDAKET